MGRRVLIIGGGASGMTAAIFAARAGAAVTILEHKDRVGKKILSTGNGRCNFTNRDQRPEYYHCSRPDFPCRVIQQFPFEDTLDFFQGLGILPKERNGYFYPNSNQASSVLDVLRFEAEGLGVRVVTECHVRKIQTVTDGQERNVQKAVAVQEGKIRAAGRFVIETDKGRFRGDALILAAGSKAASVTGSDGSGYEIAKSLGHHIIEPLPALVQLRCREKDYKQLAGIRTEGRIRLYISGQQGPEWKLAAEDRGEIQLTDYGISGIPVFQVSRYASEALHKHRQVKAVIDFLPQLTQEETERLLADRLRRAGAAGVVGYAKTARRESGIPAEDCGTEGRGAEGHGTEGHGTEGCGTGGCGTGSRGRALGQTCEQFMTGLLNKKLCLALLKRAQISANAKTEEIPADRWKSLLRQIKAFETHIIGTNSFEQAQVCCGGVDTAEVNSESMESRLVRGLYFAGEILDVDGICGGYNLQWAWSSGAVAGKAAAGGRQPHAEERRKAPEN